MFQLKPIPWAVKLALLGASLGAGVPALAQDQDQQDAAGADLGAVVVTGSRIARPNVESMTPVLAIGQEMFDALGYENIADLATALPQFSPAFGVSRTQSTFSGAAVSGNNAANLRNLGSLRSVVLINGRRAPSGNPTSTAVDFNLIPTANIERIEVLTGGAAAVYGADAVAGVINIITKKNFEGVEIGMSYGSADAGDNENPSGHLMFGGAFGENGHGLVTAQYDKQGQVSCADRYICAEDFFWGSADAEPLRGPAAYSGVGLNGRFFIPGVAGTTPGGGFTRRDNAFTDANGNLIGFEIPVDGFNRNGVRDIAIPTERLMLMAEGEYGLGAGARVFAEFTYGQSETDSAFEGHPFQSSQAGSLVGGGPGVPGLQASIPLTNPFVPQAYLDAWSAANPGGDPNAAVITWFQRFNFFGLRGANNDRESMRGVLGLAGDFESIGGFGHDWSWEISHVYGRHQLESSTEGFVGTDRLFNALRVEEDPNAPGTFRCADPTARATGCVPANPFADYTPEMIDYLAVSAGQRGESELQDSLLVLSGSLFDLPAGPLQAAIGLERRVFSGNLDYDEIISQGLVSGNQILDTPFAEIETQEAYIETFVPILRDMTAFHELSFEGAYRVSTSDYLDQSEDYDTWKYGLEWAPIEGLKFRGMRARSVRVPTPGELGGGGQTFGTVNDPCTAARRTENATRDANCAADGVAAGYAPPITVEQGVAGFVVGNPALLPEESTTLTFGLVWTPTFIDNFSLTLDRFQIEVDGFVNTIGRQGIANTCYDTADRQFCNLITRGTNPVVAGADYVLNAVDDTTGNLSAYDVAGYDVEVTYRFGLGSLLRSDSDMGQFGISLLATIYDKAETIPSPGDEVLDLLGFAGGSTSDQGYLERQAIANLTYDRDRLHANWHTRYIGATEMTPFDDTFPEIGSHVYHDVRLSFDLGAQKNSEVYVGVTNLLDKEPPFFASGSSGTQALDTIPAFYDVFGRSYYAGTRIRF